MKSKDFTQATGGMNRGRNSKSTSRLSANKSFTSKYSGRSGKSRASSSLAAIGGPMIKDFDLNNPFMITKREVKRL